MDKKPIYIYIALRSIAVPPTNEGDGMNAEIERAFASERLWGIHDLAKIVEDVMRRRAARPITTATETFSADDRKKIDLFCDSVEGEFRLNESKISTEERVGGLSEPFREVVEEITKELREEIPLVGYTWLMLHMKLLRSISAGGIDTSRLKRAYLFCHMLAGQIAWVCTIPRPVNPPSGGEMVFQQGRQDSQLG